MTSLENETKIAKNTFKRLMMISLAGAYKEAVIKVTPEMRTLYSLSGKRGVIFITSPPGLGKTTSLYRLYQQLKKKSSICTVLVPFDRILSFQNDVRYTRVSYF